MASAGHDQRQYASPSRLRFVLKRRGPHSKGRAQEPEPPYHEKEPQRVDTSVALEIIDSLAVLISERATFLSETFD
jgi:hypothetical protein